MARPAGLTLFLSDAHAHVPACTYTPGDDKLAVSFYKPSDLKKSKEEGDNDLTLRTSIQTHVHTLAHLPTERTLSKDFRLESDGSRGDWHEDGEGVNVIIA